MPIDVGSKAPTLSLPNQDLQPVSLAAEFEKGVTVLAFFPAAFTAPCTTEMCTFRDRMARLNQANAQVFGISVDTPFTLKVFARENALNFPLLSDFNKEAIGRYDVVLADLAGLKGLARRSVFVIDRAGVVRYKQVLEDPRQEPNYDALHAAIAAAR